MKRTIIEISRPEEKDLTSFVCPPLHLLDEDNVDGWVSSEQAKENLEILSLLGAIEKRFEVQPVIKLEEHSSNLGDFFTDEEIASWPLEVREAGAVKPLSQQPLHVLPALKKLQSDSCTVAKSKKRSGKGATNKSRSEDMADERLARLYYEANLQARENGLQFAEWEDEYSPVDQLLLSQGDSELGLQACFCEPEAYLFYAEVLIRE